MNPDLIEYLAIIELKLQYLMQDIKNIKSRLEQQSAGPLLQYHQVSFFTALQDNATPATQPAGRNSPADNGATNGL